MDLAIQPPTILSQVLQRAAHAGRSPRFEVRHVTHLGLVAAFVLDEGTAPFVFFVDGHRLLPCGEDLRAFDVFDPFAPLPGSVGRASLASAPVPSAEPLTPELIERTHVMNETKPWWQSSAVWGGLMAVAGPLAALAGYTVTAADQVEVVTSAGQIVGAIGGILAVVGRVRATKKIGA